MSFGGVRVELPQMPRGPNEDEDVALDQLRETVEGGGLLKRLLGSSDAGTALANADGALARAKRRLAELQEYGDELLFQLGEAWLQAGAPGRPQVKAQVDLRLENERNEYAKRFGELMDQRDRVLDVIEKRDDAYSADQERLLEQSRQLETYVDACDIGLQLANQQGMFRALDHLEQLPERIKVGIPRQNLGELKLWTRQLRGRLRIEQEELEMRIARMDTRRVRTMREGIAADGRILGKVKELEHARDRQADGLRQFLVGVGKKLVPHARTFANGAAAAQALAESRELHRDTVERIEELSELREALVSEGRR